MLHSQSNMDIYNKKFSKFVIGHIDESILFMELNDLAPKLSAQFPSFDFVQKHIFDVFADSSYLSYLPTGIKLSSSVGELIDPKTRLLSLFDSIKPLSSREELLRHFRLELLVQLARENDCEIIIFGDNSTRIAINTISLTSKGRAHSLPIDVAPEFSFEKGNYFNLDQLILFCLLLISL